VVVVEAAAPDGTERVLGRLAGELAAAFPGTLADARSRTLVAVVPVRSASWADRLEAQLAAATVRGGIVAGYSDAAAGPAALAAAYREARVAASVARATDPDGRVRGYGRLGAQRHVWTISRAGEPDPLERALGRLVGGPGRGGDLFRTLETYLDCRGNAREAAAALFIHRNTLRQRLRRISALVGLDVRDPQRWFDLSLAVRLIRFRSVSERPADA
jgi:DNA-binding PucR family transcriptional regulator